MKQIAFLFSTCLIVLSTFAQEIELVKDFTQRDLSSEPFDFHTIGDRVFFTADNYWNGRELWTSDGTEEGTRLVYDAVPGKEDGHQNESYKPSTVENAIHFNGCHIHFYNQNLLSTNLETFITDTIDNIGSSSTQLSILNGELYYIKDYSLYKTNGEKGSSELVKEDVFKSLTGAYSGLETCGNKLIFFGYNEIDKKELWISDGTSLGTFPFKYISSSFINNAPSTFGSKSGLYYIGLKNNSSEDAILLTSDGTLSGTKTFNDYLNPSQFFELQEYVYFKAQGPLGDAIYRLKDNNIELFYSLQDVDVKTEFLSGITSFAFATDDNVWVCGTTLGGCNMIDEFSYWGNNITMDGDTVYYESDDWSNDGVFEYKNGEKRRLTETALEDDRDINYIAKINGKLLFVPSRYSADETFGTEVNSVNLTTLEENVFKNINTKGESFLESIMGTDDHLYLESNEGRNIWSINGVSNVASEVLSDGGSENGLFLLNDQLHYLNTNFEDPIDMGGKLEKYNEVNGQNELIYKFPDQQYVSYSSTISDNQKGYIAIGDFRGFIWETDGTTSGTQKLLGSNTQDFGTDLIALIPDFLLYRDAMNGGFISFQPSTGAHYKLTEAYNSAFTSVFKNKFYLTDYADGKISLYRTKGTVIHKELLIEGFQSLDSFVDGEDFYVFGSNNNVFSLYKINDTSSEPVLIRNFTSGNFSIGAKIGNEIIFSAEDSLVGMGQELWVTDGTSSGTSFLYDINEGPSSSSAKNWVSKEDHIYFTADDGVHGEELWEYNYISDSFRMIEDLHPIEGSEPKNLTVVGNMLYFVADDGQVGRELWSYKIPKSLITDLNSLEIVEGENLSTVFPNPTVDNISIYSIEFVGKETSYVILDNMGRRVLSGTYHIGDDINVSQLKAGSYHVLLEGLEENIVSHFIKL